MASKYELYRSADAPIPETTLSWNMYGAGLENIGSDGHPETYPVEEPGDDQILVRVDSVGMCFSDVKLIKQGGEHPKLYHRDLKNVPTRLGHEAALTVMKVGKNLRDQYYPGQRLAIQPDIYVDGKSTAYGYTIPGGLTQYHLLGAEVMNADDGNYLLPLEGEMGFAETALTEPWACVEGAYRQRRRLEPLPGGSMLIYAQPGDETKYEFSEGLEAPATIVVCNASQHLLDLIDEKSSANIVMLNDVTVDDLPKINEEMAEGKGFADVVVLAPESAEFITELAKLIARRGTFNIVGRKPLDGNPMIDVGRLHYDYTAYIGNTGPDIAASYGEVHNRAELKPGGAAVFIGAGGPMGQMHVQRAIEHPKGPRLIIATEINDMRLDALKQRFGPLAEKNNKRLLTHNPAGDGADPLYDFVMEATDNVGADDVVVCVPVAKLMAEADTILREDGMLNLFAGVPNGTYAPLKINNVYLGNAQYTGTSGSKLSDQTTVINKTLAKELSPNRSVAAVGGMNAAREGVRAMMEGTYPGKVVIFPQLPDLPLIGLDELKDKYPDVAEKLGEDDTWTAEAEAALVEKFWAV